MLKLKIKDFKCWSNFEIDIPLSGVTGIIGKSGGGKTSLLQAIYWCFHGTVRSVAPNHMDKAKTCVLLSFNGITIERSKNPNRLLFIFNNVTHEDKVAQSLIDEMFGSSELWNSCSYVSQGNRNNFLSMLNTNKMDFLNKIAFHEKDPSFFINKISDKIADVDTKVKIDMGKYMANLESFNTSKEILGDMELTLLLDDELLKFNEKKDFLVDSISRFKSKIIERNVMLQMREKLTSQLQVAKSKIIDFPQLDPILIAENVDVNNIEKWSDLYQQTLNYETLVNQYNKLKNGLPEEIPDKIYSQQDYQDVLHTEMKYNENVALSKRFDIEYNQESIDKEIIVLKNLYDSQDALKLQHECAELQENIDKCVVKIYEELVKPEINPITIEPLDLSIYDTTALTLQLNQIILKQGEISSHINHLEKSKDVISCPKCNISLRHQMNKLILADSGPVNLQDIQQAKNELSKLKSDESKINIEIKQLNDLQKNARIQYDTEVKNEQLRVDKLNKNIIAIDLELQRRQMENEAILQKQNEYQIILDQKLAQLSTLAAPLNQQLLSKEQLPKILTMIDKLQSLKIIELPEISSHKIKSFLLYQETMVKINELIELITKCPKITKNAQQIKDIITRAKQYVQINKEKVQEKQINDNLIESIQSQINDIIVPDDVTNELEQLEKEYIQITTILNNNNKIKEVKQAHDQLNLQRELLVNETKYLSNLNVLKQYAIDVECQILNDVLNTINTNIQTACDLLFEKDISIVLNLFKTIKSTKSVKPYVNFMVSYQGGLFENIDQLSGGEGDRISLAFTLALNKLSSSPLLMLDETFSSLDLNMKETALKAIKDVTNNGVLVVIHDCVEGQFDHIINIDDYVEYKY